MTYGYAQYPAYPAARVRNTAPTGVRTVAGLHYFAGLFEVALGGVLIASFHHGGFGPDAAGSLVYAGALALAVAGVVTFALAHKLQQGRQAARSVLVVAMLAGIGATVVAAAYTADPRTMMALALPAVQLLLLNTPAARAWFRRAAW